MDHDPDEPVALPLEDTLDLHTFRPRDVGSLVPAWIEACRDAGLLEVRLVHGKGTGALRAGVVAIVERSPLVRAWRTDGNWGALVLSLWDPAQDEARVRAILEADPAFVPTLRVLAAHGPPAAWLAAGAVRNLVWHRLAGLGGAPADSDLDVAWHGGGDPEADAAWTTRLRGALDRPWEVVDQARYGHASAEAGVASWPETATAVAARLEAGRLRLWAAHGWGDLVGLVVRPSPGTSAETWRARLATKRWRARFPRVRIEPS